MFESLFNKFGYIQEGSIPELRDALNESILENAKLKADFETLQLTKELNEILKTRVEGLEQSVISAEKMRDSSIRRYFELKASCLYTSDDLDRHVRMTCNAKDRELEAASGQITKLIEYIKYLDKSTSSTPHLNFFQGCTEGGAKSRYRRLCSAFHPDNGGDATLFQQVQKQYEFLK